MSSIPQVELGLKRAAAFAQGELEAFLAPLLAIFPDRGLQRVAVELVQRLVTARRPHITQAMKSVSGEKRAWAQAKRGYRLVHTERATAWQWTKSLYRQAQRIVRSDNCLPLPWQYCGDTLVVYNRCNGKQVTVEVHDCGPNTNNYCNWPCGCAYPNCPAIIDLTPNAFSKIADLDVGRIPVRVTA